MRGVHAPDPLTGAERASDLKPDAAVFHAKSTAPTEQRFHPGHHLLGRLSWCRSPLSVLRGRGAASLPLRLDLWRPERDRAKRRRGRSVDHKLQIDAVVWQLQKVEFRELRLEFAKRIRGIFDANPE